MALEIIKLKHNSPEWLAFRKTGLGGSDAAAILGLSPFKTNVEVWEEKVGLREPEDISDKPEVKYGKQAEDLLVKLFALDYPQFNVKQNKKEVYRRGFMFASLDGELIEKTTKERGLLENKTTEIHSATAFSKWNKQIPDYYYVQVLHYLIVTGWEFAYCKGQIGILTSSVALSEILVGGLNLFVQWSSELEMPDIKGSHYKYRIRGNYRSS